MEEGRKNILIFIPKIVYLLLRLCGHPVVGFKNSTKCWICDNVYVDGDVKVRDYSHITGKYRGRACRDCNIKFKLNYKIPIVFLNLKN